MSAVKTLIKSHPVLIYFALTFAISWGCVLMVIGPGGIPVTTQVSEELMPFVYLTMLLGPSIAGILLTGLAHGRAGFRELLSRLLRWRVGARWYAVALLTAPLLATALLLVLSLLSAEFLPVIFVSGDKTSLLLSGIVAGLMVGFFEELGWTGFAVPRLRQRYGVFATGLIVGLLWGAWHLLLFWEGGSSTAAFSLALLLGRLFSWLPAYRLLMVWVYDRTGSLLVVMLMHASLVASTSGILVPLALAGMALLTWIFLWAAVLWVVVAAVAVVNTGQRSRQSLPSR